MIAKIVVMVAVLLPALLILQWLNDKHRKNNEAFRKIIHIFHGLTLASLAFIVPLEALVVLEGIFLVSMVIARYLSENFSRVPWIKYMGRVYNVGRISYGEFFFPISVILLVFLADTKWEFAASVLVLGLADAAAALVGKKYGQSTMYPILGQKKSIVGSLAFCLVTLVVVTGFVQFAEPTVSVSLFSVIWVSLVLTIAENIGIYGTDNLLIPLSAVYLLNAL